MHHLYYPRCETLNHGRSFDSNFHDGAGSVPHLLLSIKEANTSVITSCNQCPYWLPRVQDLKSLTLHWRSFPGWRSERFSTYCDFKGTQFMRKEYRRTIVNVLWLTVRYLNVTTPWPIPVDTQIFPAVPRPVGSNLRPCVSGSTFMVAFRYVLVIVKYWHWYVTVHFQRISRLHRQNKQTHAPNHILETSVNKASMIFGLASSVIWVVLDHNHP